MRPLALVILALSAIPASAFGEKAPPLRELGPDKKLGIALVRLVGADECENRRTRVNAAAVTAGLAAGTLIVTKPNLVPNAAPPVSYQPPAQEPAVTDACAKCAAYSQQMANDFLRIYDEVLAKAGAFALTPAAGLVGTKNGKVLGMSEIAAENGLLAAVEVDSVLGITLNWDKKVDVTSHWVLTGRSGWKVKIKTVATSDRGLGVFPNTADPLLKPIILGLARESARQFLERLGAEMAQAGSTAAIDLAAVDRAIAEASRPVPEAKDVGAAAEDERASVQADDGARFADSGDGTVTDTRTGLMWMAKDNGDDIDWEGARTFCQGQRVGGHADWRMPTVAELRTLFDEDVQRRSACGLDLHLTARIGLTCARVWSSDEAPPSKAGAALFDLRDSNAIARDTSEYMRALAVRTAVQP